MRLTYELIKSLGTLKDGIAMNSYQMRLLGVGWPPQHGWVQRLIGIEITDDLFQILVELRGPRKKSERVRILKNHGISASKLFQTPLRKSEMFLV